MYLSTLKIIKKKKTKFDLDIAKLSNSRVRQIHEVDLYIRKSLGNL